VGSAGNPFLRFPGPLGRREPDLPTSCAVPGRRSRPEERLTLMRGSIDEGERLASTGGRSGEGSCHSGKITEELQGREGLLLRRVLGRSWGGASRSPRTTSGSLRRQRHSIGGKHSIESLRVHSGNWDHREVLQGNPSASPYPNLGLSPISWPRGPDDRARAAALRIDSNSRLSGAGESPATSAMRSNRQRQSRRSNANR
jgi:hypothetical protein